MQRFVPLGLPLALALPLLATARPAAPAQVTTIAQAAGVKDPFAVLWVDDANGNTSINAQKSGLVHDTFGGIQYIITSDGRLRVGAPDGSGFQLTASATDVSNGKGMDYIVHGTAKANGMLVTGEVLRNSDDPSKGLALLSLVLAEQDGSFESGWVLQTLAFAGSSPSPAPAPGPKPPF